ncbi:MAG: hypothetical protein AAF488_08125 [Planctomycetota bacterium]
MVEHPDGHFEVYCYPKEVFPPTDFHTATFVGNSIILIGALSYPDDREPGVTPVYRLCLDTYRIEPIATHGTSPGWLSRHRAELTSEGDAILVQGGQVWEIHGDEGELIPTYEEWRLDLATAEWTRLSEPRPWRLFEIDTQVEFDLGSLPPLPENPEDAESWAADVMASMAGSPDGFGSKMMALGALLPKKIEFEEVENPDAPPPLENEDDEDPYEFEDEPARRIIVEGVPIDLEDNAFGFRLLVRGELSAETLQALIADFQESIAAILDEEREVQELRVRA